MGIVSDRSTQYLPYWDKAVAVLERTIARHPEEREARSFLVKVLHNRGSGREGLDDCEGALQSDRQAVEQARQLRELVPDNLAIRFEFGSSLHFLAYVEVKMGLFQSAEQSCAAAVELLRSVSSANPNVPLHKSELCRGLTRRAQALVPLGHQARADATISEARALLDEMGPEALLDRFERLMISELELARGTRLAEQASWTEVVPIFETNLRRREALFLKSPDDWTLIRDLIEGRAVLVEARLRAGRVSLTEAIAALAQVLAETEADSRRLDQPSIRFTRAEVLFRQAALQAEAGNFTEAESTLERAIAQWESETASHPQRLHWKLALARAVSLRSELHHRANRQTQALADARRAVELVEPTIVEGPGYLYELGAFQTAYRDLALELGISPGKDAPPELRTCLDTLSRAVSAGFDNAAALRQDPRLKLLRERMKPEFERLVESAVAAAKAPLPAETSSRKTR